MINDLKEQLARCESWLSENPQDQEVIDKANELKVRIQSLERAPISTGEKQHDENKLEIKRIRRKIRNLKKKLVKQPENEIIKGEINGLEKIVEELKTEREVK